MSELPDTHELHRQAQALPRARRKEIIEQFIETELHDELVALFRHMEPNWTVEKTHGSNEFGKDLVMLHRSAFATEVIAVVVKCGDISGKTLGQVDAVKKEVKETLTKASEHKLDEILSQIDQSQQIPAKLPTVYNQLPVTSVVVVLAGSMSSQAHDRLQAELRTPVRIIAIDDLIELFTKHYPQVFFEGRAVDFLQEKIQQLDGKSWIRPGKHLSDYWVDPLVSSVDVPMALDSETLALFWNRKKMPISKLHTVANKKRRMLMVGDPGTGKSAALTYLTISAIRDAYQKATHTHRKSGDGRDVMIEIPILVTAKDILQASDLAELCLSFFGDSAVQERFKVTDLYVDALDEVPQDKRRYVMDRAQEFADNLDCALLITSRKIDIIKETPKGFHKFELLPFEMGQALNLFEKLLKDDSKLLGALKDGLEKVRHQLPIVPLSLVLLIEIVERYKEVPSSVTELYDRYMDTVLGKDDDKKGIEVLYEYLIKKRFLASLAYQEFLGKNQLEISRAEFDAFCAEYVQRFGWREDQLDAFISEIDRAGVISVQESVEFTHRSFLDYYVALYLHENWGELDDIKNPIDYITNLYYDGVWTDVAFFFIGLKRKIALRMLNAILDYEDAGEDALSTAVSKLQTGRLLQAGWHSEKQIKYQGISNAFKYAPQLSVNLHNVAKQRDIKIPTIIADYAVMMLAEFSFRSAHLQDELKEYAKAILSAKREKGVELPPNMDARILPSLLWSMRPFLDSDERRLAIEGSVACLKAADISAEDEASAILQLTIMEQQDSNGNKEIEKALERRLNRLKSKHPDILQAILPLQKPGFRPAKMVSHGKALRGHKDPEKN